jgi:hypothetical protein
MLVAALSVAGCALQVNAGFPEVPPPPPVHPNAIKIGLARVVDSRSNRFSGKLNSNVDVLAGPELDDYIERQFRTELVLHSFAPIEALNPADTPNSSTVRIVAVTLQSASFSTTGYFSVTRHGAADIAIQVYGLGSRDILFARSYPGQGSEPQPAFAGAGMVEGKAMADAADRAIEAAFADPEFVKALQ